MALETATYIDSLVDTNPDGTDQRSTADDHLRLIKAAIKRTLPNVAGEISASTGEFNYLVGLTAAIQGQLTGLTNATATYASSANYAFSANHASSANYALSAAYATSANHAASAQVANLANQASNANSAAYAFSTTNATSARYATSANWAASARDATSAVYAYSARAAGVVGSITASRVLYHATDYGSGKVYIASTTPTMANGEIWLQI